MLKKKTFYPFSLSPKMLKKPITLQKKTLVKNYKSSSGELGDGVIHNVIFMIRFCNNIRECSCPFYFNLIVLELSMNFCQNKLTYESSIDSHVKL